MITEPMPHEKLEDSQISIIVCELQAMVHHLNKVYRKFEFKEDKELQDSFSKTISDMDERVTKLKKHFCPEKFKVMKVTVNELADLMAYPKEKDERKT